MKLESQLFDNLRRTFSNFELFRTFIRTKMSQATSPTEPGPTGWVKFEEGGSESPTIRSPNKKSPTSSGISSARGSVNSISAAVSDPAVVNGQPGALTVSEIQVIILHRLKPSYKPS